MVEADEIEPLREMCRKGRLFEVQDWIRQGKPVARDIVGSRGRPKSSPLRIAIDRGFHSLVQVLLEAGASTRLGHYRALDHAVRKNRPDLAALLLEHGAALADTSMVDVVESWQTDMVEVFISHGANLTDGNPIALALASEIRPALGWLKKFGTTQPEVVRQADIALRYHVWKKSGTTKWVALMLWAGANPWSRGPYRIEDWSRPGKQAEADGRQAEANAVELAVVRGRLDILEQTSLLTPPDPACPESMELLRNASVASNSRVLKLLLERGHVPRLLADAGSGVISGLLCGLGGAPLARGRFVESDSTGLDGSWMREQMKMIRMLASEGAKWRPEGKTTMRYCRQSLFRMKPRFTIEFIQIMQEHGATSRQVIQKLIGTPAMKRHLEKFRKQIDRLVEELPRQPVEAPALG